VGTPVTVFHVGKNDVYEELHGRCEFLQAAKGGDSIDTTCSVQLPVAASKMPSQRELKVISLPYSNRCEHARTLDADEFA
jgi:hypothetical protein